VQCIERTAAGCASVSADVTVTLNSSFVITPTFIKCVCSTHMLRLTVRIDSADGNAQLGDDVEAEETGRDGWAGSSGIVWPRALSHQAHASLGIVDRMTLVPLSVHGSTRIAQGVA
jgi:hypothetical protein